MSCTHQSRKVGEGLRCSGVPADAPLMPTVKMKAVKPPGEDDLLKQTLRMNMDPGKLMRMRAVTPQDVENYLRATGRANPASTEAGAEDYATATMSQLAVATNELAHEIADIVFDVMNGVVNAVYPEEKKESAPGARFAMRFCRELNRQVEWLVGERIRSQDQGRV